MRILLIRNPGAGGDQQAGDLAALVRAQGHEVHEQSLGDEGWERALDTPVDLVAVAGGDGTLGRVAKQLAGRAMPIAPLPAGTANNISRALGLTGRPYEELVRGWAEARRVKLDIGELDGPWGRRYVMEGIGAGLFARAIPAVKSDQTMASTARADAKVAYALQMLKERIETSASVKVEAMLDDADVSGAYVMFEALLLPYVGPNLFLAPDSRLGDGRFELVMVGDEDRSRMLQYLASWQDEKPRLPLLRSRQGQRLQLRWSGYPIHIDGEIWPAEGEHAAPGSIELRLSGLQVQFLVTNSKKKR
jgi:diacylglycerol kinase family enzyme